MMNFDNVRRGTEPTVIAVADGHLEALRHWLEELQVTGWTIADGRTVRDYLGEDIKLDDSAPVWFDMPDTMRTSQVSYFVSFYDKSDMTKKIAELIDSHETAEWKNQKAAEAARAYEYQQKMAADPSPFDFRRDLK